jgi:membrane-bound serine protease (ClpP class)
VILPGVALTLAIVAFLSWRTVRLRRLPVRTGREGLVGQAARVVKPFSGGEPGTVLVHGEYWTALGAPGALPGEDVRVVGLEGFTLRVERRTE